MLARMIVIKCPHIKTGIHWRTLKFQQNFIISYNIITNCDFVWDEGSIIIYEPTYIVPYMYSFETYYFLHVIGLSNRHRWPVNSLHKWPVTRKMIPFDDVIMYWLSGMHFYMNKQLKVVMQLMVLTHSMISNNTYQLHIHYISKDQGPVSLMMFQCDLNFIENWFCCNLSFNDQISIYLCP